jgi:molecular chaperone GrpE
MEKKEKKKNQNQTVLGETVRENLLDDMGEELRLHLEEERKEKEKEIEELKKRVEEKDKEISEHHHRLLRIAADFDNYKKRAAKEKEEWAKFANEDLIKSILPFIDNLERAVSHSENSQDIHSLLEGIKLTVQQLLQTLNKFGVSPIESLGKPFDPTMHNAMLVVETDQHEPNRVVEEFQRGYLLNDRLLRAAAVSVSKLPEKVSEKRD